MPKRSKKYALLDNKTARHQMLNDEMEGSIYGRVNNQEEVPYRQMTQDLDDTRQDFRPVVHQSSLYGSVDATKELPRASQKPQEIELQQTPRNQPPKPYQSHLAPQRIPQSSQMPRPQQSGMYSQYNPLGSVLSPSSSSIPQRPLQPVFPMVVASCESCTTKQRIAGNVSQFICCQCGQKSSMQPSYGVFICGVCRNYVVYPLNTSQHIRCHVCSTVNRVPVVMTSKIKQGSVMSTNKNKQEEQPLSSKLQDKKEQEQEKQEKSVDYDNQYPDI